ncbi:DNA-3-methyladenine glycosylase 2 family protein [Actinocorallia longicatena]|uniref:3-methyladenine DNA glycosylase n=1 Tax=Actinocorallia longicatena TaxID=111803 RepID=A0ABP6QSJ7_9ACTN
MTGRVWRAPWPLSLRGVLFPLRRGPHDPAFRITPDGAVWRTSWTPDGPGTLRIVRDGADFTGTAWGPGAGWLLDGMPALLGADDRPEEFVAHHDLVRESFAKHANWRIGRTDRVFEALVPAVLEQKVVGAEAWRAWGHLLRRFGEPAPGAPDMRVPPPREVWAKIPSWEWHRSGAEAVRARTIIQAARHDLESAPDRLRHLQGVGPWTIAEVRQRALGDPDALSVGDYHLPGQIGYALTGEKTDDAGMLRLLEPYTGQRYRAAVLILLEGKGPPRRGPRMSVRDYRSF